MELISRKEAIDIADRECCELRGVFGRIEDAIKALPSIESRPKGKWIIKRGCGEVIVMCSNCGAKDYVPTTIDGRFYFNRNYCWDCGADMRGAE